MKRSNPRRRTSVIAALSVGAVTLAHSVVSAPEPATGHPPSAACPKTGARIVVTASGSISLNGKPVPVENLGATLNALVPRPTEVCYFREKAIGPPPADVSTAVSAIIAAHLPVSFYSDASFANRVGMPGR
jgi:hypothetical protein